MTAPTDSGIGPGLDRLNTTVGRWADALGRVRHVDVGGWERRAVAAFLATLALALLSARHALDQALRLLHVTGRPGAGADALHGGSDAAEAALSDWHQGAEALAGFLAVGGRTIPLLHTSVELALGPVLAVLAVLAASWLREQADRACRDEGRELLAGHTTVLGWVSVSIIALVGLWSLEQLLELRLVSHRGSGVPGTVAELAQLVAGARWVLTVALAAPVALATALLALRVWRPVAVAEACGPALTVAGVPVAIFALVVGLGLGGGRDLGPDGLRWWVDRPTAAFAAVGATAWFAVAARLVAAALSRRAAAGRRAFAPRAGGARFEARLAGAGAAVVVLGFAVERAGGPGLGLVALGAPLAVVGLAGLPVGSLLAGRPSRAVRHEASATRARARRVATALPPVLGLAPLAALGAAAVDAGVAEAVTEGGSRALLAWAALPSLVGVVLCAAWPTAGPAATALPPRLAPMAGFVALSAFALAAVGTSVWSDAWEVAPRLGPHALLATFLTAATLALGGLAVVLRRAPTPAAFQMLGFRHTPVVALVALWALVGSLIGAADERYEVRLVRSGTDRAAPQSIEAVFARWVARYAPPDGDPAPPSTEAAPGAVPGPGAGPSPTPPVTGGRPAVPLVLISASGGGSRAASFTASVLDCAFLGSSGVTGCAPPAASTWGGVFAASGVSGGSVGLASVAAEHGSGDPRPGWVRDRLGADLSAAAVAWRLFAELPDDLLHLGPGMDRGEVIERGWERRWGGDDDPTNPARAPLLGPTSEEWAGPLLFLNAVDEAGRCRVNISPVDGVPDVSRRTVGGDCQERRSADGRPGDLAASRDVADYLCVDEDLSLSTAAFLSARARGVAPTAQLATPSARRGGEVPCDGLPAGPPLGITAGDGLDASGAATLLELWARLEPLVAAHNRTADVCVVPFFVEVDSGAGTGPAPAIEAAADLFRRPLPDIDVLSGARRVDERYARFALQEHPGIQAPDGWSLSARAVADLERQVTTLGVNLAALDLVATWLSPDLRCETVSPSAGGQGGSRSGL